MDMNNISDRAKFEMKVWWSSSHYTFRGVQLCQGVMLMMTNLLLLLTIIYHEALSTRKEYLMILGVALADFLLGMGMTWMSVSIISNLIFNENLLYYSTRDQCIFDIGGQLTTISIYAQGIMMIVQSVDRLMAIATPVFYFHLKCRKYWKAIGAAYLFDILFIFVLESFSLGDQSVIFFSICTPAAIFQLNIFKFWTNSHTACGCVAVSFYGIVMLLYNRHMRKTTPITPNQQIFHMKAQRRVTISMGISCLFTALLFVLPRLVNGFLISTASVYARNLRMLALLLYNTNPMLNLFIYIVRHKEIRMGLERMFKRQPLLNLDVIMVQPSQPVVQ